MITTSAHCASIRPLYSKAPVLPNPRDCPIQGYQCKTAGVASPDGDLPRCARSIINDVLRSRVSFEMLCLSLQSSHYYIIIVLLRNIYCHCCNALFIQPDDEKLSPVLKSIVVTKVDLTHCKYAYRNSYFIHDRDVCYGSGSRSKDACQVSDDDILCLLKITN